MGWTCLDYKPHNVKEYFIEQFNDEKYTVLDTAIVKMKSLYMAVRINATKEVFVFCAMLEYPKRSYSTGLSYKDMDETCGPNMYDCPERILKLLTPTDSEYANNWRQANWGRINAAKKRPSLKAGMTIKFEQCITFRNGTSRDTFTVENARKLTFQGDTRFYYKLSRSVLNNPKNPWTVIKTEEEKSC